MSAWLFLSAWLNRPHEVTLSRERPDFERAAVGVNRHGTVLIGSKHMRRDRVVPGDYGGRRRARRGPPAPPDHPPPTAPGPRENPRTPPPAPPAGPPLHPQRP